MWADGLIRVVVDWTLRRNGGGDTGASGEYFRFPVFEGLAIFSERLRR